MRAVLALSLVALAACTSKPPADASMPHHDDLTVEIRGLDREGGTGPYVSGTTETFKLRLDDGVRDVQWSATAGTLHSSGDRATWKLPAAGTASLSATILARDGQEKTAKWDFQIVAADDSFARAREALLSTPIPVLDGGSSDNTGSQCELAYDSANNVHIAFKNDTHPSLWYGVWNGTSWNVQLVDGMGFDTGGLVYGRIAMVVDSANNPHLAYSLENNGLWYATRVGTGPWTRERVDGASARQRTNDSTVSIALDPAASGRPTIAYHYWASSSNPIRTVVATRTGANTWTNTIVNFGSSTSHQAINGDIVFTPNGTLHVPHGYYYLGSWNGTTAEYVTISNTSVSNVYFDTGWASGSLGATGKLVYRTQDGIFHITLGTPLSATTATYSSVETAGAQYGDLAYAGKPYLLHLHGQNLELVTHNAQGYWSYTQLGSSNNNVMSLAVNGAGNPSVCYQQSSRVMFQ